MIPGVSIGRSANSLLGTSAALRLSNDSCRATTGGASQTKKINGTLGGTIAAGDFTVVIPPLAFSGTRTVTVSQPDLATPVVDLTISPGVSRFKVPVALVAKCPQPNPELVRFAYISYFNPATGRWERVAGSTASVLNLTVQAPLWHFSRYRVERGGRAGW